MRKMFSSELVKDKKGKVPSVKNKSDVEEAVCPITNSIHYPKWDCDIRGFKCHYCGKVLRSLL